MHSLNVKIFIIWSFISFDAKYSFVLEHFKCSLSWPPFDAIKHTHAIWARSLTRQIANSPYEAKWNARKMREFSHTLTQNAKMSDFSREFDPFDSVGAVQLCVLVAMLLHRTRRCSTGWIIGFYECARQYARIRPGTSTSVVVSHVKSLYSHMVSSLVICFAAAAVVVVVVLFGPLLKCVCVLCAIVAFFMFFLRCVFSFIFICFLRFLLVASFLPSSSLLLSVQVWPTGWFLCLRLVCVCWFAILWMQLFKNV